jgi:hypothetical protein
MEWNVAMLAVHVIALIFVVLLIFRAPCWMQALAMTGFAGAIAVVCLSYALAIARVEGWELVLFVGYQLEHFAVLLYAFRIVWQGGLGWNSSSVHSRSSLT